MSLNVNDDKNRSINQWTENPIGAAYVKEKEFASKDFFDEIESHRYNVYAPWMKEVFNFDRYKGKKVLEIGVGVGTDHRQFAAGGAVLTGVDITPKSIELTKRNLELHGFHSDLIVADAESLPFDDYVFDLVYSFGVLHHTPDTQKSIDEVYRVLKKGGKAVIALYHKNSIFYWGMVIFYDMILHRGFFKKSLEDRLSEIEMGGDKTKPLVKLYTKGQASKMFSHFAKNKNIFSSCRVTRNKTRNFRIFA